MNDEEIYDPMTGMKLWPADEKEKREWVGLTDEESIAIELSLRQYVDADVYDLSLRDFARAIEAKLREKNT